MEKRGNYFLNQSVVVPYNLLENSKWTVDSLILRHQAEDIERIPLSEYALFNKIKISPDKVEKEEYYNYVEIKDVSSETGLVTSYKTMKGKDLPSRARLQARKGDILFSTVRPERGAVAIVTPELDGCVVSNAFIVLTPLQGSTEILYFLLRSKPVREELQLMAVGTAVPTLKLKQLKDYQLPIRKIPLEKKEQACQLFEKWHIQNQNQKPFSTVVEEVFATQLDLQLNKESKKEEKHFLAPYDCLEDRLDVGYYSSLLQNKIDTTDPDVSLMKLADIALSINAGVSIRPQDYQEQGIPYVRIQDLEAEGISISQSNMTYIDGGVAEKYKKSQLSVGDIVIAKVGSVGKSAMIYNDFDGAIANQHLVIVKTNDKVIPEYIAYFLKTKWAQDQFAMYSGGAAQPFIQLSALKEIIIPVPSLHQQQKIVDMINNTLQGTNLRSLEEKIQRFSQELFTM